MQKKSKRKGCVLTALVALVVLALAMWLTNPSADDHRQAVAAQLAAAMPQNDLDSAAIVCWNFAPDSAATPQTRAQQCVNEGLQVKNFGLCSAGTLPVGDGEKRKNVSLGIFGHVFCINLNDSK